MAPVLPPTWLPVGDLAAEDALQLLEVERRRRVGAALGRGPRRPGDGVTGERDVGDAALGERRIGRLAAAGRAREVDARVGDAADLDLLGGVKRGDAGARAVRPDDGGAAGLRLDLRDHAGGRAERHGVPAVDERVRRAVLGPDALVVLGGERVEHVLGGVGPDGHDVVGLGGDALRWVVRCGRRGAHRARHKGGRDGHGRGAREQLAEFSHSLPPLCCPSWNSRAVPVRRSGGHADQDSAWEDAGGQGNA